LTKDEYGHNVMKMVDKINSPDAKAMVNTDLLASN